MVPGPGLVWSGIQCKALDRGGCWGWGDLVTGSVSSRSPPTLACRLVSNITCRHEPCVPMLPELG